MIASVAEKIRNATSVGDNRTYSDGQSREDECCNDKAPDVMGCFGHEQFLFSFSFIF